MQAIKSFEIGAVTVKIMPDDSGDQENPLTEAYGRNDSGAGLESEGIIFASFEKRSTLSDCHRFDSPDDVLPWAKRNRWDAFPLIKYEHGAVAYSISRAYPFNCPWDAGQVGWVLVKRSAFRGAKRRAEVAASWCKAVTTWCNGWYYGFVIEDSQGEHLDSCWGFDDSDYCEQEARASAKHRAAELADIEASEAEESRPDMYQS